MVLEIKKQDDGFDKILDILIKTVEENKDRIQPKKRSNSRRDKLLMNHRSSRLKPEVIQMDVEEKLDQISGDGTIAKCPYCGRYL